MTVRTRVVVVAVVATVALCSRPAAAEVTDQWALERIGAPEAWLTSQGEGAAIAVLDTGVARDHPDLAPNTPTAGRDFVDDDDDAYDPHGHGTYVAGVIAAALDGAGIAGAAPRAQILPVRVCTRTCERSAIRSGLLWAADAGARVANLSFGSADLVGTGGEDAAIAYATARGVIVVAAAGNSETQTRCSHPGFNPLVLCVGASDQTDARAARTTSGLRIDLLAPGESIDSTLPGGGYGTASGTSPAAAFVSGVAALLVGMGAEPLLAAHIVRLSARDVAAPGYDMETGWGILDARAAVELCARACPLRTERN